MILAHGFPILFGWPTTIYVLSAVSLLAALVCRRASRTWLALACITFALGGLYLCCLAWGVAQDGFKIDAYVLKLGAFGLPPVVLGGISLGQWYRHRRV